MNLGRTTFSRVPYRALVFIVVSGVVFCLFLVGFLLSINDPPPGEQAAALQPPDQATLPFQVTLENTPTQSENFQEVILPDTSYEQNCTYDSLYWREHSDSWLAQNIIIGRFSYRKDEALTLLAGEPEELTSRLLKQFLTVVLNSLNGADTREISPELIEASDWINANLLNATLDEPAQEQALYLLSVLEDYNAGRIGPGACLEQAVEPAPGLSPAPTLTFTLHVPIVNLPSNTATATDVRQQDANNGPAGGPQVQPSATTTSTPPVHGPQPTGAPLPVVQPTPTFFPSNTPLPAATPSPTNSPPPPPSPTSTPAPAVDPTSTNPPLPTATPRPTNTPRPTSTPAPTDPPPTATPVPTDTPAPTDPPTSEPEPTDPPPPTEPPAPTDPPTSEPEPTDEPPPGPGPPGPPPDPGPPEPPPDPGPPENPGPPAPEPPRPPKPTKEPRPTRPPRP